MFGFKKKENLTESIDKNIQVIPDEFYGGRDPVIYYHKNNPKKLETIDLPKRVSYDPGWGGKVVNLLGNKIFKIVILVIISLVVLTILTLYYLSRGGYNIWPFSENSVEEIIVVPPIVEVKQPEVEVQTIVQEVSTTTPEQPVTSTRVELEQTVQRYDFDNQTIDFPKTILADSADSDSDSLTDIEEEIFNTDPEKWDSDVDGYYDGQEVDNLYNPRGLAPVKIIDSGLVREYVNPDWQYRLYFPASWQLGSVDKESRQVLFNSATGDYFEVLTYQLLESETFPVWFGRKAVGQNYTDLVDFNNRFKEQGFKRRDGLVYYFMGNNKIFVLLYHTNGTDGIDFRSTMKMVAQSFRPSKTNIVIPDQVVLPEVATTTE